jgi:hypothetical protein
MDGVQNIRQHESDLCLRRIEIGRKLFGAEREREGDSSQAYRSGTTHVFL